MTSEPSQSYNGSKHLLVVITACGAISLSGTSDTAAVVALGCCNALLVSFSIALLEHAHRERARLENGNGNVVSVNAFLSQPSSKGTTTETLLAVARDVSFAATVASWLAALILEDLTFRTFRYAPSIVPGNGNSSILWQQLQILAGSLGMVLVHIGANTTLITTVSLTISVSPILSMHTQFKVVATLRVSHTLCSPNAYRRSSAGSGSRVLPYANRSNPTRSCNNTETYFATVADKDSLYSRSASDKSQSPSHYLRPPLEHSYLQDSLYQGLGLRQYAPSQCQSTWMNSRLPLFSPPLTTDARCAPDVL